MCALADKNTSENRAQQFVPQVRSVEQLAESQNIARISLPQVLDEDIVYG